LSEIVIIDFASDFWDVVREPFRWTSRETRMSTFTMLAVSNEPPPAVSWSLSSRSYTATETVPETPSAASDSASVVGDVGVATGVSVTAAELDADGVDAAVCVAVD
jgi:hypothetical protein